MPNAYIRQVFGAQLLWIAKHPPHNLRRRARYRRIKRLTDLAVVIGTLPVWVPISLLAALLIEIESPGSPILYIQKRTGKGGRQFRMFKFRTMCVGADEMKSELLQFNILSGCDFKVKNDPRVTKVGKWLRALKIDELPQLVNVLLGDMSLVGPRPTSFGAENFSAWHSQRFEVPPGITGVWQLYQDSVTELDDKVRLDIVYCDRRSVWLELKLLYATLYLLGVAVGSRRRDSRFTQ